MKSRDQFVTMTNSGMRRGMRTVLVQTLARKQFAHDPGPSALGVTASRKVGNAVKRNFAKRRLRHAGAMILPVYGNAEHAYVFVANKNTVQCKFTDLLDDVRGALHN
ncbi:MAG: ribonuclease P protein component, partial [Pseudomonadota bacterium]